LSAAGNQNVLTICTGDINDQCWSRKNLSFL